MVNKVSLLLFYLSHFRVVFLLVPPTHPQRYAQTHTQSGQHNYQQHSTAQHTPTLTQTALGGQHLVERLTQLATGLGRQVNDHKVIKTQFDAMIEACIDISSQTK